jgi:RNA polymerase sigma factor (sigma-70 family)
LNKQIDALYRKGKEEADPFTFYYQNLRPHLLRYARHVGRQTQKQVEAHLVEEMVDDLLIDIDKFRGDSAFSTWVFVRFRRRFIGEYRFTAGNLGDSLETLTEKWDGEEFEFVPPEHPEEDERLILEEFRARLPIRQREILDARLAGHAFEEIAELLAMSKSGVFESWQRILALAEEYGEAFTG